MADTFIATQDLFIGRARAHVAGEEVPADNVERNGWADQVEKVTTPEAAQQVIDDLVAFDPGKHNVDEVLGYLTDPTTTDGERDRVLLAERNGKKRAGILDAQPQG